MLHNTAYCLVDNYATQKIWVELNVWMQSISLSGVKHSVTWFNCEGSFRKTQHAETWCKSLTCLSICKSEIFPSLIFHRNEPFHNRGIIILLANFIKLSKCAKIAQQSEHFKDPEMWSFSSANVHFVSLLLHFSVDYFQKRKTRTLTFFCYLFHINN